MSTLYYALLSIASTVEECDATGAEKSDIAGCINNLKTYSGHINGYAIQQLL